MATKKIYLALVAPGRRWHLVRADRDGTILNPGAPLSLCGRVGSGKRGYTVSQEPQLSDHKCQRCRYAIKRTPAYVKVKVARDEPT